MEYIRLIDLAQYYDVRRNQIDSFAFKRSNGPGISLVSRECIDKSGKSVCKFIKKKIPKAVSGRPAAFWPCDETDLPQGTVLKLTNADKCHVNCAGVPDDFWDDLANALNPLDLFICDPDARHVIQADLDKVKAERQKA